MSLKLKILSFIGVAFLISSVISGALLIFILQQMGWLGAGPTAASIFFAIAVYLFGGLFVLGVFNALLSKKIIIPAVERERLANERELLIEQLHQAQKTEAVGSLAGSMAHDFNNLLTIIDGYSSLIVAEPKSDNVEQHAQEVIKAARKASLIIRKLLNLEGKEKTEPVMLDLNRILQDAEKMLTRLLGETITWVTTPFDEPIYVQADSAQMGQVLMNLAINARDAMPNGGSMSIKIDHCKVAHGACKKPDHLDEGNYAVISVHDTGQGIDEKIRDKIFEAFVTTKASGTGLGLSIVNSIMKENKGFIDVSSPAEGGTTFLIYLPVSNLAEDPALPPDQFRAEDLLPSKKQECDEATSSVVTILLVEDDPMIRTLITHTLEMQGYQVLLAEEGWEAIKITRNHPGKIDLLFTDVMMPGLGGTELAVAAKELYPEIKVLFMSGYSRTQLEEEGIYPADTVLEKPFTPDQVVAMVGELLDR